MRKWKIPFGYQVVAQTGVDRVAGPARVVSADRFLGALV
jgi:hypothetical protein